MEKYRMQMVYELSQGELYPLQAARGILYVLCIMHKLIFFFLDKQDQPIITQIKKKSAQSVASTSSEGHIASYNDNGDGCGATADAGIIVSDDTDGSPNEPDDDGSNSIVSSEDDNLDKDTAEILIPTYVNTPDYDNICAGKWGREHYLRYFPCMKRPPYT